MVPEAEATVNPASAPSLVIRGQTRRTKGERFLLLLVFC